MADRCREMHFWCQQSGGYITTDVSEHFSVQCEQSTLPQHPTTASKTGAVFSQNKTYWNIFSFFIFFVTEQEARQTYLLMFDKDSVHLQQEDDRKQLINESH